MALIARPNSYVAGATIIASEVNDDFDTIYNDYNGGVTNDNIASNAAIEGSKLAAGSIGSTLLSTGAVVSSVLGDDAVVAAKVADGAIGSAALAANAVVSAKIGEDAVKEAHVDYSSVQVARCGVPLLAMARGASTFTIGSNPAYNIVTTAVTCYFSDAVDGAPSFISTPHLAVQAVAADSSGAYYMGNFESATATADIKVGHLTVYGKTSSSFAYTVAFGQKTGTTTHSYEWIAVGKVSSA